MSIIVATAPFDPVSFCGTGWDFWKGPLHGKGLEGELLRDQRSLALTEVNFDEVDFLNCMENTKEKVICGYRKLERLRSLGRIIYGSTVFAGLLLDYQQLGREHSVLEQLYLSMGIGYLDFMGDRLRNPLGDSYVLCHERVNDEEWRSYWYWLGHNWLCDNYTCVSKEVVY